MFAARNAAEIAWMQETFEVAKDRDSAPAMFISQADPGLFNHPVESENTRNKKTLVAFAGSTPDGFHDFLVVLRDAVKAFGKSSAYVLGDTHHFRIDKPFYDIDPPNSV